MIKRMLLFSAGGLLLVAGLIGLVLPVVPGVLFLALAALCFSGASPTVRQRLESHPDWHLWQRRWGRRSGLSILERSKLAFWLTADTLLGARRRR